MIKLLPFALCFLASNVLGSVLPVPVSLRGTVSQQVGKTSVSIEYSRPNAKGRPIFGSLVPWDEVWRTGANRCSVFSTDTEIQIGGTTLPAGRYGLFTIPAKTQWTIIINRDADQFGAFTYDASQDILRFTAPAATQQDYVETFEIAFTEAAANTAHVELRWANTAITFPLSVTEETNKQQMMHDIRRDVLESESPTWGDLGEAARFYVKEKRDLEQAVAWYGQSLELNPDAYWLFVEQANVYRALGRLSDAETALQAGLAAAKRLNNADGIAWIEAELAKP